jgi:hypothetical protein
VPANTFFTSKLTPAELRDKQAVLDTSERNDRAGSAG